MQTYLLIGAPLVAGVLVLAFGLGRVASSARRLRRTRSAVTGHLADRSGLLRARIAAWGVAIRQRRRVRIEGDLARVPSGEPAQTGGRP
ncbi:MAG TPA: bacteriophage holin [Actinophytocola sp.]|uniref:bacteriophage holin n=1 Tax=Actinophytocola sp. TaxID=1872138 RepID=UPI002DB8B27D|nr:bacteriophage holin [Actinophytocola sp.]HEU5474832.1 bacteriophage holin [Actinophytocola sp.]